VAGRAVAEEAPEFCWTAVPDAPSYRLQLAAAEAFATLYYDESVEGPTAVALADVVPAEAETVVWRVRAETGPDAPWSPAATFTRGEAPAAEAESFLVDAPPVPIRPIQDDAVDAAAATLTWEGVPEASGYRVQVAPGEAFDDPAVDLTLDRTTTLTLFDRLPSEQDPLFWRVCALFPNDSEGPWSDPVRFGTDPDVDDRAGRGVEEERAARADADSIERSAVAAGPARESHTSNAMALTFIAVLVVSFLLTILVILLAAR
jgi:hypothetical protein